MEEGHRLSKATFLLSERPHLADGPSVWPLPEGEVRDGDHVRRCLGFVRPVVFEVLGIVRKGDAGLLVPNKALIVVRVGSR